MIQYRYDQLQFSTEIPNFINLSTPSFTIACSGTIGNGNTVNFTGNVNINNFSTFNDFKIVNQNTNQGTYLTNNSALTTIWQYVSSETVQNSLTVIGTLATVTISVSNFTGGTITLTPQTYRVEVVGYQLPF